MNPPTLNNGRINLDAPASAGGPGQALGLKSPDSALGFNGFPGFQFQQTSETNFQADMLRGNWSETGLSQAFFSKTNIDTIQNDIRRNVFERSQPKGYVIDNQSVDELKIIMRAMFYQYAKYTGDIQAEVKDLNERVLKWCVPHILSAVEYHMYYLKDIETYPVPLSHPVNISRAGTKSKPLNPYM
jgi:hypothetical protein